MAHIEKHKPGSFCWIELATTDQKAAQKFYHTMFGWGLQEVPTGPNGIYDLFQLEGKVAAAGYELRPDQTSAGVPPHWMVYINVENVDAATESAKSRGGKVMMGPFDVMEEGRMSVIQDPTGAMFSLWQGKKTSGTGINSVPGTLCWAELATRDIPAGQTFYEGLLGWKIFASPTDNSGYLHIQNGEEMIGGIPPSQYMNPNAPPHWLAYFYVADCDASANTAKAAGGRLFMEPMTIEKVGRMAVIADPQGAVFAIFTPAGGQ